MAEIRIEAANAEWDNYRRAKARAYLGEVRRANSLCRDALNQLVQVIDELDGIKAITIDGMPHGTREPDDAIVSLIMLHQERSANLQAAVDEFRRIGVECEAVLQSLECHENACEVVRLHFIDRKTYARIARDMYFSEPRIKQICADALLEIYEKMPHRFRDKIPRADG